MRSKGPQQTIKGLGDRSTARKMLDGTMSKGQAHGSRLTDI
jgi:hypothetical protein